MVVHHIWKAGTEDYFEFKASLDNIAKTYLKIIKKKRRNVPVPGMVAHAFNLNRAEADRSLWSL